MRAAIVPEFRNPEVITVADVPAPVAGEGQLLVRMNVAGVNFADLAMTRGTSPRREPPFSPGVEGAGTVEGDGTRVVYWEPMPAAYAEFAAVDAWRCVPIPDDVSDEVAVALMVQGATAHYLALDASGIAEGQTCLVYSAAGGVGHLLTQIARMRGARVLAVVGSDAKAAFVRERGAEVVINRNSQDIVAAVNEATDGQGVDAVYDAVGAATIEQSLRATRDGGTCILYGGGSGPVADLPESLTQRLQFKRTSLATHLADEHAFRSRMGDLFEWYRSGQVVPHIAETWPLDQAAEALKTIATGDTVGKLLIRVRPEG